MDDDDPRKLWKLLFTLGANVCAADHGCPPPLHVSSFIQNKTFTKLLIKNGADVNARWTPESVPDRRQRDAIRALFVNDWDDWRVRKLRNVPPTPLGASLHMTDEFDCACVLVKNGARLEGNEVSDAASYLSVKLLRLFLAYGGDPNESYCTKSPLRLALERGERSGKRGDLLKIVELLLKAGATVQPGDISFALRSAFRPLVERLLRAVKSFSPDASDFENVILMGNSKFLNMVLDKTGSLYSAGALCTAVARLDTESGFGLVKTILERRPRGYPTTKLEATPIGMSALHPDGNLTRLLLQFLKPLGAPLGVLPVNRRFHVLGAPLIKWLQDKNWTDLGRLDRLAGERFCHERGWVRASPLVAVLKARNSDALSEMLRQGFAPDQMCLALATKGPATLMELLIANPAKIKKGLYPYRGEPMLVSIQRNDANMARLLTGVVDVNFVDKGGKGGRSPLQAAIKQDQLEIMEVLIEAGADVNGEPAWNGGVTALQVAAAKG